MKGRKIENGRFIKCYDSQLTKEYLKKEYPKQGAYRIAKIFNMHPKTIYNYLEYYNIPRNRKQNNKIKKGQVFGLLTLIEPVGKLKNGTITWKCLCDCGNTTVVPSSRIKIGGVKSCGCLNKIKGSRRWNWKGYCGISGGRFSEIRLRAKKKKWEFNLTPKFLWTLYQKQNQRCAITNEYIDINIDGSLDRIDSKKGYLKNNVWWVKKDINKMKLDFPLNLFIELCEKVVKNKENIKNGR